MEQTALEGFLLINKPKNITSFDCIRYIKRIIKQRIKIGHAGTLDPFASGLLIIAIGRGATKNIPALSNVQKTYTATGKLGELTDTLDKTGTIIKTCPISSDIENTLKNIIQDFPKAYIQTPPVYSALKVRGKRLYALAREKKLSEEELKNIIRLKSKEVIIFDLSFQSIALPFFTIDCSVSHGTYVRSLINDIAQKIGSCATTYELERTGIGPFTLSQAIKLNPLKTLHDIEMALIPVQKLLNLIL